MTKQFTLLQLFSVVDGRLSSTIEDVYDILNHACNDELMTHHLPIAMDYLKEKNPKWFVEASGYLHRLGCEKSTPFETCIKLINNDTGKYFDVPQLKDEFDTSDFDNYMIENSLL